MPLNPDLTEFTTVSPKLINVDWQDLDGTGTILFYGYATKSDTTTSYHISKYAFNSAYGYDYTASTDNTTAESASTTDDGSAYKAYTAFNFDLSPFVESQTVKGTATAIISYKSAAASGNADVKPLISIIHYSGSTETVLGSAYGQQDTPTAGAQTAVVSIPLTQKTFAVGDILRCKVTAYIDHNSGANDTKFIFAHNPLDEDTSTFTAATNTTQLKFYVPFQI